MFVATIDIISVPEKNLMLSFLQIDEQTLSDKVDALNTPCEETVNDLLPGMTVSDGMWKNLKTEYIVWQIWREYNNPGFIEKSQQAKTDFMYFIELIREGKFKAQTLSNQSDLVKTKGVIII